MYKRSQRVVKHLKADLLTLSCSVSVLVKDIAVCTYPDFEKIRYSVHGKGCCRKKQTNKKPPALTENNCSILLQANKVSVGADGLSLPFIGSFRPNQAL